MDVVFNTRSGLSRGSARVNIFNKYDAFRHMDGVNAAFRDYENYEQYDFAILYGPEHELHNAKAENPDITVGLAKLSDHTSREIDQLERADFLIADSESQRDYYLQYNGNITTIPLIEKEPDLFKRHRHTEQITLAYHGNKEHLESFDPHLKSALERLDERYDIRLLAVYNIDGLGYWERGRPDIEIEDIQHSNSREWNRIHRRLVEADIGLVPAGASLPDGVRRELLAQTAEHCSESNHNDYICRFKNNTNAGRAFVFMQLGVPVVVTPLSELRSVIDDGVNGYTALTEEKWVDAVSRLADSARLRTEIARNAHEMMRAEYTNENVSEMLREYMRDYYNGDIHGLGMQGSA